MKSLRLSEAKNRFSEVIAWVETGQEVAVMRRGVAIAKVVRLDLNAAAQQERTRTAFAVIDAIAPIQFGGQAQRASAKIITRAPPHRSS